MSRSKFLGYMSVALGLAFASIPLSHQVSAESISNTDFESGTFTGWEIGSQVGNLSSSQISGSGTGVNVINGPVTFNADAHASFGSPTLPDGSPNPYYAPAVESTVWTFGPFGNNAALLQPSGQSTFDGATNALGLSSAENSAIKSLLSQQASASGFGSGNPTDASWLTTVVNLEPGVVYTMSWNYIGTDYVPFNDGSITSLVYQGSDATPVITVNNGVGSYALLGFTNPGTGDYSTGTFGSTGWQISTYEVSQSGSYLLGFAVFNLDDSALSPVLLVDSAPGSTLKNGEEFGAVAPNNPDAPVVTTTEPPAPETTTEAPTTTTTEPEETTTVPETTVPYVPPIFVPAPESTTTEAPVVESTTTQPLVVVAPTVPSAPELPKTGSGSGSYALIAMVFIISGSGLLLAGRLRKEF